MHFALRVLVSRDLDADLVLVVLLEHLELLLERLALALVGSEVLLGHLELATQLDAVQQLLVREYLAQVLVALLVRTYLFVLLHEGAAELAILGLDRLDGVLERRRLLHVVLDDAIEIGVLALESLDGDLLAMVHTLEQLVLLAQLVHLDAQLGDPIAQIVVLEALRRHHAHRLLHKRIVCQCAMRLLWLLLLCLGVHVAAHVSILKRKNVQ